MADDTPFFIVGSGRSGTTLLRLMLTAHSRIHIPPETWFITDLARELPLAAPLSPVEVTRAAEIITSGYRWPDMQIPVEDFRLWASSLTEPKLAEVLNLVYHHQLKIHGKQRFGDKTPPYIHIIPEISTIYPGAKFIHLIRDGRDVAISYIELHYEERYYERNFDWTRAMRRRRDYLDSAFAAQILEVWYEDLVARPELTLRKLCDFIEEAFEPSMLCWQDLTGLVPERERQIHPKLGEPLRDEAISVWRRKLSPLECFAIESCLHADLCQLGYRLYFKGAGWRPLLAISGWLLSGLEPLLIRAIPYLQRRKYLPRTIYI
jgi:hypothetical protein